MSESLSRSQRLAIAATTAVYAAAYVAAASWLVALISDLGLQDIEFVAMILAFIAAPALFPFWRSRLGPAERQLLCIGAVVGAFLASLLAMVASLVVLDPNLSAPIQSPEARLATFLAALVGAMAGAYFATFEISRPPAPAGSDEAVREEKEWAVLQRKGRRRVLIEKFCFGFVFMIVISSYSSLRRGGWGALRDQWTYPAVSGDIAIGFAFGCWLAYIASVRWNDMARRQGGPDAMPLTTRSA